MGRTPYTVNGVSFPSLRAVAAAYGLKYAALYDRVVTRGRPIEESLGPSKRDTGDHPGLRSVEVNGERYPSLSAFAAAVGITYGVLQSRRRDGWTLEEIAAEPVRPTERHRGREEWKCHGCRQVKPRAAFWVGKPERCKDCIKLRQRIARYGPEVQALLDAFDGSCALCHTTKPGKRGWNVDHCHTTGRVRGILCGGCNMALGAFMDDPKLLRRAARYLETR